LLRRFRRWGWNVLFICSPCWKMILIFEMYEEKGPFPIRDLRFVWRLAISALRSPAPLTLSLPRNPWPRLRTHRLSDHFDQHNPKCCIRCAAHPV
jgi:hypothetical protein